MAMQTEQDHYKILGILPNAETKEITEAYRKLAFQYHPDRNHNSVEANEKMREINVAYATLSDPVKRKDFDIPRGYHTIAAKFSVGAKVKINIHSPTPFRDHLGVIDREPEKDAFRFWYTVKLEMKGFSTTYRFAEEEITEVIEPAKK